MFSTKNASTYAHELGQRVKELRLQRNLRQRDVAADAGLSAPTLRALENHGRGTIEALARVMYVLGRERELEQLLAPDPPSSLEELAPAPPRKRARR